MSGYGDPCSAGTTVIGDNTVTVSSVVPSNPTTGDLWWDTTLDRWLSWDGVVWNEHVAASTFIELLDVPNSYAGQASKLLRVLPTEDGIGFVDPESSATVAWGGITGNVTDQSDLTLIALGAGSAATADTTDFLPATTYNFGTITVSGQSDIVAGSASGALVLVAGTNVTITTDATQGNVTISASGGGGGIADAPNNGATYARKDAGWVVEAGAAGDAFALAHLSAFNHSLIATALQPAAVGTTVQAYQSGLSAWGALTPGGAATLSVGTTTGTVAAGDDSRFHAAATLDSAADVLFHLSGQQVQLHHQDPHTFMAGPTSGSSQAAPTFRTPVAADIPDLSATYAVAAKGVTGGDAHTHAGLYDVLGAAAAAAGAITLAGLGGEPAQTAATQAVVEAGTEAGIRSFSPARIFQAIAAKVSAMISAGVALGTPTGGTLTNCTGLPLSTGVTGAGSAATKNVPAAATRASSAQVPLGDDPRLEKYRQSIKISPGNSAITAGTKLVIWPVRYACVIDAVGVLCDPANKPASSPVQVDVNTVNTSTGAETSILSAVAEIATGAYSGSGTISGATYSCAAGTLIGIDVDQGDAACKSVTLYIDYTMAG